MLFVEVRGSTTIAEKMTTVEFSRLMNRFHETTISVLVQALLRVTGRGEPDGPWVPVGVGVHTGPAWMGSIAGASGAAADFTALGDNVNIAARLASQAGPGELLASEATCDAARIEAGGLEKRELELKGRSELVSVRVLRARSKHPRCLSGAIRMPAIRAAIKKR